MQIDPFGPFAFSTFQSSPLKDFLHQVKHIFPGDVALHDRNDIRISPETGPVRSVEEESEVLVSAVHRIFDRVGIDGIIGARLHLQIKACDSLLLRFKLEFE